MPTPPSWARTNDLGQLFDRTIQVYRRNFVLFATISVLLAIPDAVILIFHESLATDILRFISAPFILGAFYLAATHVVFYGPIGPLAILLSAVKRYPNFAGVITVYIAAALTLGSGTNGTWFIVGVGSTACIMAAESLNPWQTFLRQSDLLKGNTARASLGGVAILIFSIVPMVVLLVPASIVIHLIPTYGALSTRVGDLLVTLITCLTTPIVPIGVCLVYVQLRARSEGLDLDDLAMSATDAA